MTCIIFSCRLSGNSSSHGGDGSQKKRLFGLIIVAGARKVGRDRTRECALIGNTQRTRWERPTECECVFSVCWKWRVRFRISPLAQHPAAEGAELKILWGEPVSEKKKEDDDRSLHLSLRLDSITRMFSSTKLVPPKLKRKKITFLGAVPTTVPPFVIASCLQQRPYTSPKHNVLKCSPFSYLLTLFVERKKEEDCDVELLRDD